MPKISVIVPVYNVETYLNRCVDSILIQTFSDFELILVDDGSKDNSGAICDEYTKEDERVFVIHKANGGLSDARNTGLECAKGEYVAFIDSDDWVDQKFLQVLYEYILYHHADIAAVNFHKEYDDRKDEAERLTEGCYTGAEVLEQYLYDDKATIYINIACNKLYRKALFENIRYPLGKFHEDGFTTYRLLGLAQKVYVANDDLYFYYQRKNSIMNREFSLARMDEYIVYKERAWFFKVHSMDSLYQENEKVRIACMKSLAVRLLASKLPKAEKKKWLAIFSEDLRKSGESKQEEKKSRSDKLFCTSPKLFYYLYRIKKLFARE
ncbi:MAG: glycosyltransferase [Clostridia bacterium]|nr:glycosyltransferase [Clostridia bacterium]